MADLNAIADNLSQLTVLEAAELAKMLEEKWGVSAAAPVVQQGGNGPAPVVEAVPEQTEFDVTLTGYGEKKIDVMKAVRSVCGVGLKEAQEIVNGIPNVLKAGADKDEAAKIKAAIEEAGGTVELK